MLKGAAHGAARGILGRLVAPRLRCSFCRRGADDVQRLVAGARAYICDRCVAECVAILATKGGFEPPGAQH